MLNMERIITMETPTIRNHKAVTSKTTCYRCGGTGKVFMTIRDRHGVAFEIERPCRICGLYGKERGNHESN